MALSYTDAHREDLGEIVAIYNSTIASRMVTADTAAVTVASRAAWFDAHCPSKRPLWMVQDAQQERIGWVSFQSFYGRPAYDITAEISIYLHPEQRGKGYGREILQYCLKASMRLGIQNILAFIFAHNIASIKLFEKEGFQTWGHLPQVAILDEQLIDLKILGKKVI